MDFSTLLAALIPLTFLIYWSTDLLKDITNGNWNGVVTKAVAFLGAFGIVTLYAHSSLDLGGSREIFDALGWTDQALLALAVAAGGGTLADGFRVFNHADDGTKPTLLPPVVKTGGQ